jgi:Mg/Co/Ni transporter MgtE
VAQIFADSDFNHLPVVDDGVLVGVVTPADVLRTHLGHVQQEAGYLRDYISGVYY